MNSFHAKACALIVAYLLVSVHSFAAQSANKMGSEPFALVNRQRSTYLEATNDIKPSVGVEDESFSDNARRKLFVQASLFASASTTFPLASYAADSEEYRRSQKDFAYTFVPPPGFETTQKPVKTHLDEINFVSSSMKGYQIGVTVDPVRIKSLKEFGTPAEVAARVVTAEVNRDGVFDVTLKEDAIEDPETGAYEINYLSSGKRGEKHFVAYVNISNGKLYVLTGQIKEENYEEKKSELLASARSFRIVSP
mmetsp:Transcript_25668/g.36211  ORF Transcript_25668/g.36211 Transcript_25668/m.36211 type:complete len:252 (+) Transcript_25668:95-850(+)